MLFHKLTEEDDTPLKLPSLQLNGNINERENSLKFLGVILDKHLTWKKHLQLIENKVSKNVYEVFTSPLYTLTLIMKNFAWASTNKTKLKKLFETQKQVAYIIFDQDIFTCPSIV